MAPDERGTEPPLLRRARTEVRTLPHQPTLAEDGPTVTPEECRELARHIVDTWTLTPKFAIWLEALLPMVDADAARKTYAHLRRHQPGREMSVHTFTEEYRRHRPHQTHEAPPDCADCDGGWRVITYTRGERQYRGVQPCTCPAGRECERTWRHVEDFNERERLARGQVPAVANAPLTDADLFHQEAPT